MRYLSVVFLRFKIFMKNLNVYLTFDGNCEQAFNFYHSILGGKIASMSKFKDMPPSDIHPEPITGEAGERIMHIHLILPNNMAIMASDILPSQSVLSTGNNFSLSIDAESEEEATTFFNSLMEEGQITMPLQKTFWGAYFGIGKDKFGIQWMVNYDYPQKS